MLPLFDGPDKFCSARPSPSPELAHVLVKQSARIEREAELATKQQALPKRRYGVIYADPPWRFELYSRSTGMDRAADNHYPVMDLAAIKALDVSAIATPDCMLFLWATGPMNFEALDVMRASAAGPKSYASIVHEAVPSVFRQS
jgi:hypothetical protein